jgi:hypothetical protein
LNSGRLTVRNRLSGTQRWLLYPGKRPPHAALRGRDPGRIAGLLPPVYGKHWKKVICRIKLLPALHMLSNGPA